MRITCGGRFRELWKVLAYGVDVTRSAPVHPRDYRWRVKTDLKGGLREGVYGGRGFARRAGANRLASNSLLEVVFRTRAGW